MGFPRQEYWRGLPFPSPRDLPDAGIEPKSPALVDFPGGSDGKESACNVRDSASIPGSGRSLGEGNGHPLQYSCLANSMDRGAWWVATHSSILVWRIPWTEEPGGATVHEVTKSQIQLRD